MRLALILQEASCAHASPVTLGTEQAVKISMSAAQARTTATRMRLAQIRSATSRALAMLDTKGREQAASKMTAWAGTAVTSTPSAKTCQGLTIFCVCARQDSRRWALDVPDHRAPAQMAM